MTCTPSDSPERSHLTLRGAGLLRVVRRVKGRQAPRPGLILHRWRAAGSDLMREGASGIDSTPARPAHDVNAVRRHHGRVLALPCGVRGRGHPVAERDPPLFREGDRTSSDTGGHPPALLQRTTGTAPGAGPRGHRRPEARLPAAQTRPTPLPRSLEALNPLRVVPRADIPSAPLLRLDLNVGVPRGQREKKY